MIQFFLMMMLSENPGTIQICQGGGGRVRWKDGPYTLLSWGTIIKGMADYVGREKDKQWQLTVTSQ